MGNVDQVYTHGNDKNIAVPGRPLNASRDMVEGVLLKYCLKKKVPMLAICGGVQKYWFEQGATLQRTGAPHSGDIFEEDIIVTVPEEGVIYNSENWSANKDKASDLVFNYLKNVGFAVNNKRVRLNCMHTQSVLYDENLKKRVFELDPEAIIITSELESDNGEYGGIRKVNYKDKVSPLVEEKPIKGKVTIVEAVLLPSYNTVTMQSHPDGFRNVTLGDKVTFNNTDINKLGIDTDNVTGNISVVPNVNSGILENFIGRGRRIAEVMNSRNESSMLESSSFQR